MSTKEADVTTFEIHTEEQAPEEARSMLEKVREAYGFVPNLMGVLAEAPAALESYLALGQAFGKTSFTPVEQQVLLLSVSRFNGCTYCMAAHSAAATMAGMEDETLRALRKGRDLTDPHLEALRRFTTVVQESRGEPSRDEIKAFLAQGFTRAQVLEVLVGVAMKTLSNYTNHLANTPLDEAFADFRWDEE
jgi:uncharacterized peroxidase-related enzyme